MRGFRKSPGPAATQRLFIYGDAPAEAWIAQGTGDAGEPWVSFERAQQLARARNMDDAAAIWRQIASTEGLESRHALQAWHFLRQAARVMVLTPSGPHFGQGPAAALQADPMAGAFLGAAANLLQLIVSRC